MRVLIIAHAGSVHTQSFVSRLQATGVEVRVLSLTQGVIPSVTVDVPPVRWKWQYALAIPYARRLVRRFRPDVVYGMFATSNGLLAVTSGCPKSVVGIMGSDVRRANSNVVLRGLLRFVLSRASLVHTVAQHLADQVRLLGGAPKRILTLPRGIDIPIGSCHSGPATRIVSTRHLEEVYDPATMLRGFAIALRTNPTLTLTVVGGGRLLEPMRQLAVQLGVSGNVQFTGPLDNRDVRKILSTCGTYVSASIADGTSVSLLEAMAFGCLPVLSDIPANREHIRHGESGLLFPPGDERLLASAILAAVESPEAWRASIVRRNCEYVRQTADANMNIEQLVAAFQQLP